MPSVDIPITGVEACDCCGHVTVPCLDYPIAKTLYLGIDTDCDESLPAGSELPISVEITWNGTNWTGTYAGHTFTGGFDGDCNFHVTGEYGAWCFDQVLIPASLTVGPFSATRDVDLGSSTAGSDGVVCGEDISFDPGDCPGGATLFLSVGESP